MGKYIPKTFFRECREITQGEYNRDIAECLDRTQFQEQVMMRRMRRIETLLRYLLGILHQPYHKMDLLVEEEDEKEKNIPGGSDTPDD